MRTREIGNQTIIYPDEVAMAFNPMIIRINSEDPVTAVVRCDKTTYKETRYNFKKNGDIVFDISKYVQSFFSMLEKKEDDFSWVRESAAGKKVYVQLEVPNQAGAFFEFETYVIWGALNFSNRHFNNSYTATWFKNFPFTFSVYVADSVQGTTIRDGKPWNNVSFPGRGLYECDASKIFPDTIGAAGLGIDFNGKHSVFDITFDHTFRDAKDQKMDILLQIDDCTDGTYLRWIDRHGFFRYWLFKNGRMTAQTKALSNEVYTELSSASSFYNGVYRGQGKSEEQKRRLYVEMVNDENYDFFKSVATSPIVEMYINDSAGNYMFLPVTVENGTFEQGRQHLQTFELLVTLQDTNIQEL